MIVMIKYPPWTLGVLNLLYPKNAIDAFALFSAA
jgi:hypothetical protein